MPFFLIIKFIKVIYNFFIALLFWPSNIIIHIPERNKNSFFYKNSRAHKNITKFTTICAYVFLISLFMIFCFENESLKIILSIFTGLAGGIIINFIYYSRSIFIENMERDRAAMDCMRLFVIMNDIYESIDKSKSIDDKVKKQIADAYTYAESVFSIIISTKPELIEYFRLGKEMILTLIVAVEKGFIPENLSELSQFHIFFSRENMELLMKLNQLNSFFPYFEDEEFYKEYKKISQKYAIEKNLDKTLFS